MENENNKNFPFGRKEAANFVQRGLHDPNCVPCPEMALGILGAPLNPDPHGAGPRSNVGFPEDRRRPRDEPAATTVRHDPNPHPYGPDPIKKMKNTYGGFPYERGK